MNKKLLILMVVLISFSFVSAVEQDLGVGVRNDCMNLVQTCDSCTYNNISRVLFPNSTEAVSTESNMTGSGIYYNYSFCSTSVIGEYVVIGHGDLDGVDTVWSYTFKITRSGEELNEGSAIVYIGLLLVLVFLFVVSVWGIGTLPSGNDRDDDGYFIGISKLKYLRGILVMISYMLLMSVIFTASNIALSYFNSGMFGNLLFDLYSIMMFLTLPMIMLWLLWIFVSIFKDKELKRMIERGVETGGSV